MESYFKTFATLVAALIATCSIWLGFMMYIVATDKAMDTTEIEQQIEQAKQQYIAWFNEYPTK